MKLAHHVTRSTPEALQHIPALEILDEQMEYLCRRCSAEIAPPMNAGQTGEEVREEARRPSVRGQAMTAQGIATVTMDGGQFDFLCLEVLHLAPRETKDAYLVDKETVSTDACVSRLFVGKIVAWRPRLVTEPELAALRDLLASQISTAYPDGLVSAPGTIGQLFMLAQLLLGEVERHRTNLEALEDNLKRWPGTMTRERLLSDLRDARTGYHLEMLT